MIVIGNTSTLAYATPQQYSKRFGLTEAANLLAGDERLLTVDLLRAVLAQGAMPAGTTQAENDVAAQALDQLIRALVTASNLMDGYLRAVATLPIPPEDANAGVLEECCCHLTRHSLSSASGTMTDAKEKENARWLGWLRDVSARRVQLISTATQQQAPGAGAVRTGRARSGFDWNAHGAGTGYRE